MDVKRGDVFYADLNPVIGSEQGGIRPVLILQNDIGNYYSPTTIVAAVTSRIKRAKLPTHVELPAGEGALTVDSVILMEQLRTIDKARLRDRICRLDDETMKRVVRAVEISLGLIEI
ncbi:MAG: type II toxin-antitoxin system PemK/MazF family toxin [Clostridia bacterium]|nr:type II toxin-antitoxin system PemK/MazF family toxin [Clostridia bacterium]